MRLYHLLRTMKYLLAIDSFKGCLSSPEVEETLASALQEKGAEVILLPLSDGGEGMLEAFTAVMGGRIVPTVVRDPLGRPISAAYGIAPDGTAIIETAKACGLTLMTAAERNPLKASTYGVGELIVHALRNGSQRFIIGLGGSGTSDAGWGMLEALAEQLAADGTVGTDPGGCPEEMTIRTLQQLGESALKDCTFTLACDVRNPLCGPNGAAYTFGRQKGANEAMLPLLDERAFRRAELAATRMGYDRSHLPGAGAAGGLGYAFLQFLDAETRSGADLLLDLNGFDTWAAKADVVITGEGRSDRQTLMGKLPERVLRRAQRYGTPVWLMAGRVEQPALLVAAGFARVDSITPEGMPTDEAILPEVARRNIRRYATLVGTAPD